MENVLLQLADAADYPAFCAGQDGEVLYANRAAEEQWPVWQGCTLPELLPEFFAGGEYRPYFRYFGSCHIFSALGGWKLEVLRFKDAFFCRVLPESQLEGLPESWAEDELERIRTEVLSIVRQRSSIEDILLDENATVEQIYLPLTDILSAGDSSCRRISLSCNRLEAGRLNPERYPPQQVDLTDALSRLVHEIRVELPGLKAPVRAELPDMFAKGISSFKMYLTYPAMMIGDRDIYWALKELKRLGGIAGFHCENAGVIDGMIAERKAAGELSPASHPRTRPPYLEAEAVSRLLRIAQAADAPVVIVHLTNREALLEVDHARKRGQTVYVETCPQYLLLDESVYFNADYSAAARYVCAPPLRDKAEQEYLWKGLRRGAIQTVSTDHCSFTLAQKDMGREDFTKIPGGLPGVETRGELMYSYGVARRKISAAQMCRVLSENPARLYGLYPRKGVLRPGSDADIVVYDPGASHVIRAEDCVANVDYNPYEGFVTAGGIRQVWLRGRLSVEDGKVLAEAPAGKYMARGKNSL